MPLTAPGTQVGTSVYIAEGAPATEDITGFEALTWIEIWGVQTVPDTGFESNDVTVILLKSGVVLHSNGSQDGGTLVIPYVYKKSDAGQQHIRNNVNSADEHSIKIVDEDGDIEYGTGVIGSNRRMARDADTHKGYAFQFRVNGIVYDDSAVA